MEEMGTLVQEAKKGNQEAFSQLYTQIYLDLYKFALYTLKNKQDAEDVVSDTVMSAFEQIRRLRQEEAFRGWIFKILTNQCKRKLKEYIHKTVELPEDLGKITDHMSEDLQVRVAFSHLTSEERLIISMHLFAGYSSKEIGKILHMSDSTVRSKESRALKKMRSYLQE